MNDLERWLHETPLESPSPSLDERVGQALDEASRHRRLWKRPVPLWLCLAACALCLLAGWAVNHIDFEFEAPVQTVHETYYFIVDGNGMAQQVVDQTPPSRSETRNGHT